MSTRLTDRGLRLQYLVDNEWQDLTKPVQLLPLWDQAAGFVYVCPALIARQLAESDGLDTDDVRSLLEQYGREARDVAAKMVGQCKQDHRPVMQLDTASTEQSFEVALRDCGSRSPHDLSQHRT
jgi:hypothetical protein